MVRLKNCQDLPQSANGAVFAKQSIAIVVVIIPGVVVPISIFVELAQFYALL